MRRLTAAHRFHNYWIIPLIAVSISCQAVFPASLPATAPALHSIEHQIHRQPTYTPTAPADTPTPLPSPTSEPTATATATIIPSQAHFRIFEELWKTVRDLYLYEDFNGLDWDAVHEEINRRIGTGLSDEGFYVLMKEMVSRLDDEHSIFLNPDEVLDEDAEFAGNNHFVGIGILTTTVPERKRVTIILVFPGSPAEQAGLKPHDSILEVGSEPILDENGFRRDLLRGPAGTEVALTVQTPGQDPRQITLIRNQISGPTPVPSELLETPQGRSIGYILLTGFSDETVDEQIAEVIQRLSAEKSLDGLIIDNRQNSGGADEIAREVLSYFTSGILGYFVDRYDARRSLRVSGTSILNSNSIPLAVLIGPNTVSFGEIFSGVLRDAGRAYLIGETTEGNMELLWGYDFEGGSRAWIAREAFQPLNSPDDDWEETGIVPDLYISSDWDKVILETDPAIIAALEYMDEPQGR